MLPHQPLAQRAQNGQRRFAAAVRKATRERAPRWAPALGRARADPLRGRLWPRQPDLIGGAILDQERRHGLAARHDGPQQVTLRFTPVSAPGVRPRFIQLEPSKDRAIVAYRLQFATIKRRAVDAAHTVELGRDIQPLHRHDGGLEPAPRQLSRAQGTALGAGRFIQLDAEAGPVLREEAHDARSSRLA